jgi:perosamine synthetase
MIPQYKPLIDRAALADKVREYILSDGYFTEFRHTAEFEKVLAAYLGVKHCFALNNGTISLSLALLAVGVQPGDRVLVPNITMIATCNAARLIGAVPVLIDVDPVNLCMNLRDAEANLAGATAVLYVTLNGRSHGVELLRLFEELCRRRGVSVIQDNAQSLGSRHDNGEAVACVAATVGSFSFSMPKIITTGQGGCLVTNDDEVAWKIGRLKDFGRARGGLDIHDEFGVNCKFTEIQALMGLDQMKDIGARCDAKRRIYAAYADALSSVPQVQMPANREGVTPWFVDIYTPRRDELKAFLHDRGIGSRPVYPPLTSQTINRDLRHGETSVSTRWSEAGLWLPCSMDLTADEIETVCRAVKEFFNG